jgi:hypothetical protein
VNFEMDVAVLSRSRIQRRVDGAEPNFVSRWFLWLPVTSFPSWLYSQASPLETLELDLGLAFAFGLSKALSAV